MSENTSIELNSLLSKFKTTNPPAKSIKEAKQLLSTQEISDIIENFTGLSYPKDEIVEELENIGYKFELIENQFVWLIASNYDKQQ